MIKVFENELAAECVYVGTHYIIKRAMSKEDNLSLLSYCISKANKDVVFSSAFIIDCISMSNNIGDLLGVECLEMQQQYIASSLELLKKLYIINNGNLEYIQKYFDKEYSRIYGSLLHKDLPPYTYINYPKYSDDTRHKLGDEYKVKLEPEVALKLLETGDYTEVELHSIAQSIGWAENSRVYDKLCDILRYRNIPKRVLFLENFTSNTACADALNSLRLLFFKGMTEEESEVVIDNFWEYHLLNNTAPEMLQGVLYTKGMLYPPKDKNVRTYALKTISDIIVLNPKSGLDDIEEHITLCKTFLVNWGTEIEEDTSELRLLHYSTGLKSKYLKPNLEPESRHKHTGDCVEYVDNHSIYKGYLNYQETRLEVLTAEDVARRCNAIDQKWYVWHIKRILSDVQKLQDLDYATVEITEVLSTPIPYKVMDQIETEPKGISIKVFVDVVSVGDTLLELWKKISQEFRVQSREEVEKLEKFFELDVRNKTLEILESRQR